MYVEKKDLFAQLRGARNWFSSSTFKKGDRNQTRVFSRRKTLIFTRHGTQFYTEREGQNTFFADLAGAIKILGLIEQTPFACERKKKSQMSAQKKKKERSNFLRFCWWHLSKKKMSSSLGREERIFSSLKILHAKIHLFLDRKMLFDTR